MKKWSLRILITTLALLLLLAAAVQVVLWTDMPRNWVLGAIQEKLRLRVSAQRFSTGWSGRTDLSGVVVSLPLEEEALLQANELSIQHTSLLSLILGRSLKVERITIVKPNLLVEQQPDGRWNLEAAAELIRRAGGGKIPETQSTAPTELPQLPAVTINDAIVRLVDIKGRQATLSPLSIKGEPDGRLVWNYDASIPGQLHIKGQAAPGGSWQHDAHVELSNLLPLIKPFLANPSPQTLKALEQFKLAGDWSGHASGSLVGRLDLSDFFLAGYSATGPLSLSFNEAGDGVAKLTPSGVVVTSPYKDQIPPARFANGTIVIDSASSIQSTGLTIAIAGGELRLSGAFNWIAGDANLQANWNNLVLPKGSTHGGTLTASIHQPWPNQPVIAATLASSGRSENNTWSTTLKLDGDGIAWDHIDWKLTAPALTYQHANQTYNLDNLAAKLATRGHLVSLDDLSIPPGALYGKWQRGQLEASGKYDLTKGDWHMYLSGTGWPIMPGGNDPADFQINLSGDQKLATLHDLFLKADRLQLWGAGDVSYATGLPVELALYGWYPPVDYTWHERGEGPRESVHLSGHLWSELHLKKNAWPLDLKIDGTLYGKGFKIKEHEVGDVAIKVDGSADQSHVQVGTTRMELLGGIWGLHANLKYQDWLSAIEISLKDLPLAQIDNFSEPPPKLVGVVDGRWNLNLPIFDVGQMTANGEYSIRNLGKVKYTPVPVAPALVASLDKSIAVQAAHVEKPTTAPVQINLPDIASTKIANLSPTTQLATVAATMPTTAPAGQLASVILIADTVTGKINIVDGLVTLDPIRLVRKPERGSDGITVAKITFPVFSPRQMHFEATAAAWPVKLLNTDTQEISNVIMWARTKGLDVDFKQMTATGPIALDATIAFKDQTLGLHVDSQIDQRRLVLNSIRGDGLGGYIIGDGFIDLENPLKSQGQVQWNEVDAQSIIALAPPLDGLNGKYSGTFRFSPTDYRTDRDASGPFAFSGEIWSLGGNWKGLPIGDLWFIAHGEYQAKTATKNPVARAVVDKMNWDLAGGNLKGWSRVTWYDLEPFAQVNFDFDKLSLDQIVKALRPPGQEHKPMPGLLSGNFMAAGNPFTERGQQSASGEAKIRLTESDLVNVPAINLLYTLMSVKIGPQVPSGRGLIVARLEGKRLEVPAMRYSNRGTEIWAKPVVVDVFKGAASPIEGVAAGSASPLRDLKLPFMADIDRVISAWTGSVATVQLNGTVGAPAPRVILFSQSGETFRRFLLGEVKNEMNGTAGR